MTKTFLLTGAAVLALSTAASAATFTLDGGTPGLIPGGTSTNEVLTNTFGFATGQSLEGGFFGANVLLDEAAEVTVNYFGYEAGFTNTFFGGGSALFSTTDGLGALFASDAFTPLGTDTFASGGGIVDFSLFSNTKNSDPNKEVKNGANPDNSSDTEANFYAWITKGGATSGETVFLFFDDGGAGPDDNHDDFVVSLSVGGGGNNPPPSPVPLPAGGLLMLGGLGAFAIARRRKNKS